MNSIESRISASQSKHPDIRRLCATTAGTHEALHREVPVLVVRLATHCEADIEACKYAHTPCTLLSSRTFTTGSSL